MVAIPGSESFIESLQNLIKDVRTVVGADAYERMLHNPHHRLTKLHTGLQGMVNQLRDPSSIRIEVRVVSHLEMNCHLRLLRNAKGQLAGWAGLMAGCVDAEFFDHFLFALLFQETCRKFWGLEAEIIPETEERTSDIMVYSGGMALIAVEMKSKMKLKDPVGEFDFRDAQRMVKAAMNDIGSSNSGQLRGGLPGLLVIGGFFLDRQRMVILAQAARDWFRRNQGRKKSLIGVLFMNSLVAATPEWSSTQPAQRSLPPRLDTALDMEFVRNPSQVTDIELTGWQSLRFDVSPEYDRWAADMIFQKPTSPQQ
jgi:hypothetical protein